MDSGIQRQKIIQIVFSKFLYELIRHSTRIKDKSFEKENESRIVYHGNDQKIQHREGKSMMIPYIESDLVDSEDHLPISKIIVGPTLHKELSRLSIEYLVTSLKYEIEVVNSKIPYRSL